MSKSVVYDLENKYYFQAIKKKVVVFDQKGYVMWETIRMGTCCFSYMKSLQNFSGNFSGISTNLAIVSKT